MKNSYYLTFNCLFRGFKMDNNRSDLSSTSHDTWILIYTLTHPHTHTPTHTHTQNITYQLLVNAYFEINDNRMAVVR